MDGTQRLPSEYTGRFGIHAFQEIHKLCVLRLPTGEATFGGQDPAIVDPSVVEERFRELSRAAFAPLGGFPEIRSSRPPVGLFTRDRSACGILEDTRRAKRLITDDEREMMAAHLSQFAYANPTAGALLIRQALDHCARHNLAPAMFVAIPFSDLSSFLAQLSDISGIVQANATVYGTEFTNPIEKWHVSTSEI
ncbi:MAG: hypothetical protein EOP84_29895 [Verrucomicrobiaceae bacterium]|nr:MAG: hypothetical protein EOP84_29895 [Verrucomicrobiaceae bacterium]